MKKIFDYFLEKLNDNELGLVYKGNFIFRFFDDGLRIYEPVEGKLINEEIDYRPVSLTLSQAVPFTEKNERLDWLVEFGMLIPISGEEFDEDVDIDYNYIKSVCAEINGSNITYEDSHFSFKLNKYPQYNGIVFLGRKKYARLSITMVITEFSFGEFGQESSWYIDDELIDVILPEITSAKRLYTNDKKETDDNDKNKPIGRSKVVRLTINYDPDNIACQNMWKESRSISDLSKTYELKEVNPLATVIDNVIVRNISDATQRNGVRKLIVEFVEADMDGD